MVEPAARFSGRLKKRLAKNRHLVIQLLALAVLAAAPLLVDDVYLLRVLTVCCLLSALAIGAVISFGYAGLPNVSQGTFYGIGAYVAAIAVTKHGIPFELAIVIAIAAAALLGAGVGLTTIRISGDYWWLVSMAFTVVVARALYVWEPVTGGVNGYVGIPEVSFLHIDLNTPTTFYYGGLFVLVIAFAASWSLVHSFVGRAFLAVNKDESAASMFGIWIPYFKVLALAFSAGLAGLAGAFLIAITGYIHPSGFDLTPSFNITLFAIVGGIRSLYGAIVATTLLTFITEEYRALVDYELLFYGGAVLLAIFVRAGVFEIVLAPVRRALRRLLPRFAKSEALAEHRGTDEVPLAPL
jgi:branched-chain amino acid transport system permease protein